MDLIQAQIAASNEYSSLQGNTAEGFVKALYADFIGRELTASELETHTNALRGGADRVTKSREIATTQQAAIRAVDGLYAELLRRSPD